MDIKEFLSYLTVSHGPNGSGDYMCRCPAHQDRTASLSVGTGDDGRILVKCMAGCDVKDIVAAMGLKMSDLYPEDGRRTGDRRPKPQKPKPAPSEPARQKPLGKLVKVYPYTDEDGATIFEVCRFESTENGQREKTFRQRHADPSRPGGYIWNLKGVRSVIYRLPEIRRAIAEGRTVYLVEGEKDADTLASMGFCATTNPGGASKSGRPKWLPEHSQLLAGADVVILPDNDAAGLNDRQQVAVQLGAVCRTVKLLDLRKACPGLPPKGDITDMMELMGRVEGLKALRQLEADTPALDLSAARASADRDAAAALINNLPGYCVDQGCICTWADDNPKRLCTFTAITSGIVMRDDGVNEEKCILVDGWTAAGDPLPRIRVPAAKFRRMDWLTEAWDIRANIMPGTTATDKVRFAISEAGAANAIRLREYTHTGWRRIDGSWCYLYRGGAIGADGVSIDLGAALDNYCMDEGYAGGGDLDAVMLVPLITAEIPRRISVPLVSLAFLAPLRDALVRGGHPPAFSAYLVGGSGTLKSTISALVLSFFGRFTELSLPASFNDTANYIRKKAFALKDMLLAVDDYHPEGNLQARRKMEDTAQQLARAFGDLAQRGRMNADQSLSGTMPPRCMALISGEDMPNIRESGEARYYVINIGKGDIEGGDSLTYLQDQAADGALAHAMRRYIEWLAPQMDRLPAELDARFKQLRAQVQKMKIGHSRAPGTIAHLLIGYEMYLRFLVETGALQDPDGDLMRAEMSQAALDIAGNAARQSEDARGERPSRMFLNTVGELLLTRAAGVVDLTDPEAKVPVKGHIGYMDALYYYLVPGPAYTAVCEICTKNGTAFPLTQRMLARQLLEDGLIVPDSEGKSTRVKTIGGRGARLMWIPRANIDGPQVNSEQTRMDLSAPGDGFKEVSGPTPFE